jgi:hypothetical protein
MFRTGAHMSTACTRLSILKPPAKGGGTAEMATYKIDTYHVRLWSSRPTTELNPGIAVAGIYLYEAGTYRGYAYFYPDGTPLAPAVIDAVNGAIYVHFNLSQLTAVLQLLREERPIYLYEFGPDNAGLMTGGEPTGEEEGLSG